MPNIDNSWKSKIKRKGLGIAPQGASTNLETPELAPKDSRFTGRTKQLGLRVSEAVSFDYSLKHPKHKNLYLVHGKGNKTRYVYVSPAVISELKTNCWKPNQTNRFAFNNFLKKVKGKMDISENVELTLHTLRRCY